jgi:predicted hydrocarbon binding protein
MAKAKGTTLLTLVKFLRSQRKAARERLSPELHHYLEERIQPALWYPEEDLLALIRAMLELLPLSREKALAQMGRTVACEHLEGVYGHLRVEEKSGLATLARRSYALWASMHDTGRMVARLEAEARASFELRDYGLPSPEMCAILTAYFSETLRMAGVVDAEVRKLECRGDGAPSCRWEASWQNL